MPQSAARLLPLLTVLLAVAGTPSSHLKAQPYPQLVEAASAKPVATPLSPLSVYRPEVNSTYKYGHAAMVVPFNNALLVMWSAAVKDEDTGIDVVYARSRDHGATWGVLGQPYALLAAHNSPGLSLQSAGWWVHQGTLVAYIGEFNTWYGPGLKQTSYRTSTDGVHWRPAQHLLAADGSTLTASMEESPKRFGNRLYTTFNRQNDAGTALVQSPYYTDDLSGISGWTKADFAPDPFITEAKQGKELEGSIYQGPTGLLYTVYRNMRDHTLLRSASTTANGEHWRHSVDWLDVGQNKSSAGNLPNGEGFFLANPYGTAGRFPLNIHLTRDGLHIARSYTLLTLDPQDPNDQVRFPGLYKGLGFSYPNTYVDGEQLWIAYARHKEDIELLRVPTAALAP